MSTHRITKQTTIPFPCWLWSRNGWAWFDRPIRMQTCEVAGFTHYSTNPPDQRPEDVVQETLSEVINQNQSSTHRTIEQELAALRDQVQVLTTVKADEFAQTKILIREYREMRAVNEKLRAELEEVTQQRENARKAYRSVFEKMKETRKVCEDTVGQLTKNNAELRDQIQVLSTVKANEFEQTKQLLRDNETLRAELERAKKELAAIGITRPTQ